MSISDAYDSHDALGLAALVAKGDVTPAELLDEAIARVERLNPKINAVVHRCDDLARQAIASGLPGGPFRGVPFLLKDLYTEMAGTELCNGSALWTGYHSDHDTNLVARYKAAGLVIFGRTTSPEFGLTATTESRVHGDTRNPWDLSRSAGGSSGGASAAVAAGILPMANASDGGGSIRIPASACGLFGIKPTRGRTPMGPDTGEGWAGMSTVHAVSRSVRDSAALLDATAGPDLGAPYYAEPPRRPCLDEAGADPGRLRIALQRTAFNGAEVDPACIAAVEDAAKLCQSLGHEVEEAPVIADFERLGEASFTIIKANIFASARTRAAALGRDLQPDDLEPIAWATADQGSAVLAVDYVEAVKTVHAVGRQVAAFMERYDVILSPTMATPPMELGRISLRREDPAGYARDIGRAVGFTSLFNASGNPAMSVPLYWDDATGLPIGVQFAGRYGDEATLFRLAGQLEQARPWANRRPSI
ncbi:MAG: amidase [Dehalococcoidia bacterium]